MDVFFRDILYCGKSTKKKEEINITKSRRADTGVRSDWGVAQRYFRVLIYLP